MHFPCIGLDCVIYVIWGYIELGQVRVLCLCLGIRSDRLPGVHVHLTTKGMQKAFRA